MSIAMAAATQQPQSSTLSKNTFLTFHCSMAPALYVLDVLKCKMETSGKTYHTNYDNKINITIENTTNVTMKNERINERTSERTY